MFRKSDFEKGARIKLSVRDSLLVMELLENPPPPNAKMRKAARALLRQTRTTQRKAGDADLSVD